MSTPSPEERARLARQAGMVVVQLIVLLFVIWLIPRLASKAPAIIPEHKPEGGFRYRFGSQKPAPEKPAPGN